MLAEQTAHDALLDLAELGLAALVKDLGDRPVPLLDLLVSVDERAARCLRDLLPHRRLARPHEADEGDVLADRAYRGDHGMRSR